MKKVPSRYSWKLSVSKHLPFGLSHCPTDIYCLKSAMQTQEQCEESVQIWQYRHQSDVNYMALL